MSLLNLWAPALLWDCQFDGMSRSRDLFDGAPSRNIPQDGTQNEQTLLHASCVAFQGRAVLIRGASGSGKSALALQLMAYGASLVADDQSRVWTDANTVWVAAPETTKGLIEARGVGILHASEIEKAALCLVVDMDHTETDRLPHPREASLLGHTVRLLFSIDSSYFAAAILQFLRHGRNFE